MRSFVLTLVLGISALGIVALTPDESQAFGHRRAYYGSTYYPSYSSYSYHPSYSGYSYYPSYSGYSYYPSYSNYYSGGYRSYYPGYASYYSPRTVYTPSYYYYR